MRGPDSGGIGHFFEPSSIAVAGVSNDQTKLASIIFSNLLKNRRKRDLKASLYPVNPAHSNVCGVRCYPGLDALPLVPELLVVAVPVSSALELVKEAAELGVKAVVVVTGGFAEVGRRALEQELLAVASREGMRILGPNTMGLLDTKSGIDTLFLLPTKRLESGREVASRLKPSTGGVVVITQSGHLGEIVLEDLVAEGVGLRALVGTGNQVDVSVEDIIDYFAADDGTKVIAVYLEGVKDGRRFIRLAGAAAKRKPVVVFKMGKTMTGARAAMTHTASLVGDYEAYRAAFRAAGIVEAESLQELVDYCAAFSLLPQRPRGRLLIVTNAGGVGGVAADEAEKNGLEVRPLGRPTAQTIRKTFEHSPFISNASLNNPLDLTATVPTADFAQATEMALASREFDMALILPTHQTPAMGPEISSLVAESVSRTGKPACVCVMGRAELARMIHTDFISRGIPSFPTPERAVRALAALSTYTRLRTSAATPPAVSGKDRARSISRLRGPLAFPQTRRLLAAYGITQPRAVLVESDTDLAEASRLGFPVACKLASRGLLHKADIGGVLLNVGGERKMASALSTMRKLASERNVAFEGMLVQQMVQGGVELILGGKRDPTFGPMVVFGAGGSSAELVRDFSVAVAPVDERGARDMVKRTRIGGILGSVVTENQSAPRRLLPIISRFSRIMAENPSISQMEVNPLTLTPAGTFAVDTRVVLHD